jgi:hypothetical protein
VRCKWVRLVCIGGKGLLMRGLARGEKGSEG